MKNRKHYESKNSIELIEDTSWKFRKTQGELRELHQNYIKENENISLYEYLIKLNLKQL